MFGTDASRVLPKWQHILASAVTERVQVRNLRSSDSGWPTPSTFVNMLVI